MAHTHLYDLKDEKLVRKKKACPKCEGAYLADHPDRLSCGKCGYTEFKNQ